MILTTRRLSQVVQILGFGGVKATARTVIWVALAGCDGVMHSKG
jgi:hypothetical protein